MEKLEGRRDFNFLSWCLVGKMKKLRDEKHFCLVVTNLYKFTIVSQLDKTKNNMLYFY